MADPDEMLVAIRGEVERNGEYFLSLIDDMKFVLDDQQKQLDAMRRVLAEITETARNHPEDPEDWWPASGWC